MKKTFFFVLCASSLKSLKKGVGYESASQRYGSADPDPDPHQSGTNP